MADEVIQPKDGLKSCLFTVGIAVLIFLLCSIAFLLYVFVFDDSLGLN